MAVAGGHSAFRFLNQAPKTGAIDVYMIPAGNTWPIPSLWSPRLPSAAPPATSASPRRPSPWSLHQPACITPKYTSQSLALSGGEVRTILIVDTQFTSNPPVEVFTANDVN